MVVQGLGVRVQAWEAPLQPAPSAHVALGEETSDLSPGPIPLPCAPYKLLNPSDLQFARDRVEADTYESSGHLPRRGAPEALCCPLWTPIPPAESPDLGYRCGLTVQGRQQILGCGTSRVPSPSIPLTCQPPREAGRAGPWSPCCGWESCLRGAVIPDSPRSKTEAELDKGLSTRWGPHWGTVPHQSPGN